MKKLAFIIAAGILSAYFLISPGAFAQSTGGTTEEEYNYLTKGYKVQLESGLDMKKGYTMKEYITSSLNHSDGQRDAQFKGLIRDGQTAPCAILLIYKQPAAGGTISHYICIPNSSASQDVWKRTLTYINDNFYDNPKAMQMISWGLMKFSSMQVTQ
ncbi:MAG TPA: hypothetical protein VI731_10305 [Bacteroidia bacterium]|nr:hypothetical protein [Bacteroidia bacterium]